MGVYRVAIHGLLGFFGSSRKAELVENLLSLISLGEPKDLASWQNAHISRVRIEIYNVIRWQFILSTLNCKYNFGTKFFANDIDYAPYFDISVEREFSINA